jgi:hypothetical protein
MSQSTSIIEEHPRLGSYPLWSEDLGEQPTPEEIVEIGEALVI